MKHYAVSVEELGKQPDDARRTLTFEVKNHDDILAIVDRLRLGKAVPAEEAEELAVGFKLFSEVVIRHRNEPLFSEIFGDIGKFIKRLKTEAR